MIGAFVTYNMVIYNDIYIMLYMLYVYGIIENQFENSKILGESVVLATSALNSHLEPSSLFNYMLCHIPASLECSGSHQYGVLAQCDVMDRNRLITQPQLNPIWSMSTQTVAGVICQNPRLSLFYLQISYKLPKLHYEQDEESVTLILDVSRVRTDTFKSAYHENIVSFETIHGFDWFIQNFLIDLHRSWCMNRLEHWVWLGNEFGG